MKLVNRYRTELALFFVFTFSLLFVSAAFAQEAAETTVRVPYGEVIASIVVSLGAVASGLVYFIKSYLPAPARWALELTKLDQLAEKAISAAVFDIADDLRGKSVSLEIKNKILRDAVNYSLANAKEIVDRWGPTFETKLKARIQDYLQSKLNAN